MQSHRSDSRKVQRRISLQTKKRDAQQILPETIIMSIIDHQHLLFKNKSLALDKVYSTEISREKQSKILNDWIYIASSYCYILFQNDLDGCDELALEMFSAFYFIVKFVFKEQSNSHYHLITDADRLNIEILFKKYQDFLSSSRKLYYQFIIDSIDSLSGIDEVFDRYTKIDKNIKANGKSLDPKAQRKSIQSPYELYPQSDLLEISSTNSDSSFDASINNEKTGVILKPIDIDTFASLDPKSLIILNIQSRSLHSSNRTIITIDPTLVDDSTFFQNHVLPYLKYDLNFKIIIFSKSETITILEKSIFNQLIRNNFNNIYWLTGGYYAFKQNFIKASSSGHRPYNFSDNKPKIPQIGNDLNNIKYSKIIPNSMLFSDSNLNSRSISPPPIPLTRSLLSSNESLPSTAAHQIPSLPAQFSGIPGSMNNRNSLYGMPTTRNPFQLPQLQSSLQPPSSVPAIPTPKELYEEQYHQTQQPQIQYQMPTKLDYKPVVTLRNLGSTCYINSMIQCLFSLDKFRDFFINDEKLRLYLKNLKGSNAMLTSGFHELFNLFYSRAIHGSTPPIIEMNRFLSIIAKLNPSYNIPNEQQDTSQFLYYIIAELHKELKFTLENAQNLNLITINGNFGQDYYNWQLRTLQNEGFSAIQNLFTIKEAVVMKCSRCGYTSTRYDTSIMLHLSLKNSNSSLNDILSSNFVAEEMSSRLGNSWDCDGCTKAEKELEILQEKMEKEHDINLANSKQNEKEKEKEKSKDKPMKRRFFRLTKDKSSKDSDSEATSRNQTPDPSVDLYSNTLTDKEKQEYNRLADIFTRERIAYRSVELIELPDVLVLCLSLFNSSQQDVKFDLKNLKFPETLTMEFNKCCRVYKLNSWIDHWGSNIDSGHYTATVDLEKSQWITCDDDKIQIPSDKTGGTVKDSHVYLLFYEAI